MVKFWVLVAAFIVAYVIVMLVVWAVNLIYKAWKRYVVNPIFLKGYNQGYRSAQQDYHRGYRGIQARRIIETQFKDRRV